VTGSRQRQWASYAILSRLVLIERLWRLYTSQVVSLQVVASVELTILMPGTVVDLLCNYYAVEQGKLEISCLLCPSYPLHNEHLITISYSVIS
jgi:hypothetical protein